MSADDQAFLDTLSSVPNDIRRYSSDVADYVERHLDKVSSVLREQVIQFLPESARPKPPPPPPKSFLGASLPASTYYERLHSWVLDHKFLTTVIVVVVGGVTYRMIRKSTSRRKKRRAKRAGTGARLEVVVVAGSPSEPITRSISLDLERRGFIVYVVCNTIEEEVLVQNESRSDIKPLMIDIVDPQSAKASIERFTSHLQKAHSPIPGTKPHHLNLRSLLLIPSLSYPTSPLASLPPSQLSDLLNTRLLTPILTLQTFLPLLQTLPFPHPHLHPSAAPLIPKPSILVLTPSIISSLNPAFHLPESVTIAALNAFTSVLSSELSPLDIPVTHIQLGTFDTSAFSPHNKQLATRAETLRWDESTRGAYARNFVASTNVTQRGLGKGSSLRELNDAVFDAMVSSRGGTVRVGMGSSVYGFVGRWVPRGLVGWMMGVRKLGEFGVGSGKGIVSPKGDEKKMEESGYVSVYNKEGEYLGSDKGVDEV